VVARPDWIWCCGRRAAFSNFDGAAQSGAELARKRPASLATNGGLQISMDARHDPTPRATPEPHPGRWRDECRLRELLVDARRAYSRPLPRCSLSAGRPACPVNAIPPRATAWVQLPCIYGTDSESAFGGILYVL
jgi:hypothetical protein